MENITQEVLEAHKVWLERTKGSYHAACIARIAFVYKLTRIHKSAICEGMDDDHLNALDRVASIENSVRFLMGHRCFG